MFYSSFDVSIYSLCSKRRFREHQAKEWWSKNKDRVHRKYIAPQTTNSDGTGSSNTLPPPPPTKENIETVSS